MLIVRNSSSLSTFATLLLFCYSFSLLMFGEEAYGEGESNLELNQEQLNIEQKPEPQDSDIASFNNLLPEGVLITPSLTNSPMPRLKQSKLGQILTRYYNRCLGGADHWKTIKSIKISASLNTASGPYQYVSIIKKPNLYKIIISAEETTNSYAFDGTNKWQKRTSKEEESFAEVTPQMNRMLFEPELASFLLYPFRKGKDFQYIGTVREFNTVCYKIRLVSDLGYLIDYFIDVETYFIVTVQITDTLNEFSPVLIQYSDHRLVEGIYFAHKKTTFLDNQWDSSSTVEAIATNVGAATWMFNLEDNSL